jgi:cytochrome P450
MHASQIVLPVEPAVYRKYRSWRHEGPIVWDDADGAWAVLDFELCEEIESDEERFVRLDNRRVVDAATYEVMQHLQGGSRSLMLIEGEPHRRLHGGLSLALTRQVRAHRHETERLAVEHMANLSGEVEFCAAFSELFPTSVITAVLGMPWNEDEEMLRRARVDTALIGEASTTIDVRSEAYLRGVQAADELREMLRPDVERLMLRDDKNTVAEIYRMGREIYDDWSLEDVLVQCRLLYFAGSNSSAHFLANIAYVLATSRSAWERLDADRSLIPRFLEEILRVIPPVQARPRRAVRDTDIGGTVVKAGDLLMLYNAAANRQADRFDDPDAIDLDQASQRHLSFNAGPRACPGAPTARMEGRAVVEAMLDRFERIELDPTKPEPIFVAHLNSGYMPLHLIMTPKHAVDAAPA